MADYQVQLAELFEELDEFMYDFESFDEDPNEDESDEENYDEEEGDSDQEVYVQSMDDGDEDEDKWEDEDKEYKSKKQGRKKAVRPQKPEKKKFVEILSRTMKVIRQACNAEYPGLPGLIEQVDRAVNKAIRFAYDDNSYGPYAGSHVPSFAHDDEEGGGRQIAPLLHDSSELDPVLDPNKGVPELQIPPSWSRTFRPHPLSTPCARFRDEVPEWEATSDNQNATAVFEARCEIASTGTASPASMKLSSSGSLFVSTSIGGYKNLIPYLSYYFTHDTNTGGNDFVRRRTIKVDLTSCPQDVIVDEPRGLINVGDWDRIKSYRYIDAEGNPDESTKKNVHTMDCKGYNGPLAILANGRLARAGKQSVAIWNLDDLPTYGVNGTNIIGNRINEDDLVTWRDDPEHIEPSTGSKPTSTIKLDMDKYAGKKAQEKSDIGIWQEHPSQTNIMLCGSNADSNNFYCHAYDLEAGGKPVVRYLGHGGSVDGFSTSARDPNVFLTWCSDGHARLYDTRQVLPVVTIGGGAELEQLPSAILAHPDGIPFVFMGGDASQCIKVWDIRARSSVYELATGNNAVSAMAWDAATDTLYASTECPHLDWHGNHYEYGIAKILRHRTIVAADDEDDGKEEYEPPSAYKCWPKRAVHSENYFGRAFDAGGHRLYKISYKMQPDSDITGLLP